MKTKIKIRDLNVFYREKHILKEVNLDIFDREILSVIGPANSGKSSFLRVLNRLLDINCFFKVEGSVHIENENIYSFRTSVCELREKVGIIFAIPVALPMSIFDNMVYGPKLHAAFTDREMQNKVEKCLKLASLWDEVKDRLHVSALKLSGGQQQRLCIARALMVEPEIILFDEPCSGLDPISTSKVEATMLELKKNYTVVLVTNNTKQASRVGDRTAFFLSGELVEVDKTKKIFTAPKDKRTNDYITGRFG